MSKNVHNKSEFCRHFNKPSRLLFAGRRTALGRSWLNFTFGIGGREGSRLAVPMLPAWSLCSPSPAFSDHSQGCRAGVSSPPWGHPAWQRLEMAVAAPGSPAVPDRGLSVALGSPAAPRSGCRPGTCREGDAGIQPPTAARNPGDTRDNCSLQRLGSIQLALKGLQMVQSGR